jgi:hypothetical protein
MTHIFFWEGRGLGFGYALFTLPGRHFLWWQQADSLSDTCSSVVPDGQFIAQVAQRTYRRLGGGCATFLNHLCKVHTVVTRGPRCFQAETKVYLQECYPYETFWPEWSLICLQSTRLPQPLIERVLFLAQQPDAGQGRLMVEISRSHSMTHHSR